MPFDMEVYEKIICSYSSINWPMLIYLLFVHVTAVIGISYITLCETATLVWFFTLSIYTLIGITGGYHRLWAHRSYRAHWALRVYYMILGCIANQGSIYHWVRDHRIHHKYSETDSDPHNVMNIIF